MKNQPNNMDLQNVQRLGDINNPVNIPLVLRNFTKFDPEILEKRELLIKNNQTKGNNKVVNAYKNSLPNQLDKKVLDFLVGLCLSDATIQLNNSEKNVTARLKIQQSVENTELLIVTKQVILPWVTNIFGPSKSRNMMSLHTFQHKAFLPLVEIFQDPTVELRPNDCVRKVIKPCIIDYLTPIALLSWVCGDGGLAGRAIQLHSQGFSYNCNQLLAKSLRQKYGWEVRVIHDYYSKPQQRDMYFIEIRTESSDSFKELMEPIMIPSFKERKLPAPRIRKSRYLD